MYPLFARNYLVQSPGRLWQQGRWRGEAERGVAYVNHPTTAGQSRTDRVLYYAVGYRLALRHGKSRLDALPPVGVGHKLPVAPPWPDHRSTTELVPNLLLGFSFGLRKQKSRKGA